MSSGISWLAKVSDATEVSMHYLRLAHGCDASHATTDPPRPQPATVAVELCWSLQRRPCLADVGVRHDIHQAQREAVLPLSICRKIVPAWRIFCTAARMSRAPHLVVVVQVVACEQTRACTDYHHCCPAREALPPGKRRRKLLPDALQAPWPHAGCTGKRPRHLRVTVPALSLYTSTGRSDLRDSYDAC